MSFTFAKCKGNAMIIDGEWAIWIVSGRDLAQPQLNKKYEDAQSVFGPDSRQDCALLQIQVIKDLIEQGPRSQCLNSPLLGLTTIVFPLWLYLIYSSFVAAAVDSCKENK